VTARSVSRYVLVVDDDIDVRESMADILRVEGVEAVVAGDGREALRLLQTRSDKPSLILLDLMMPRMSGWELLEHLGMDRALAAIPVCVVSASGASLPSGAQAMLSKPFDMQRLLDVVARHAGPPR
jgi:CheY-like chemotaxis protein